MSKTYNQQFFDTIEYIQKFRNRLSEKKLLDNLQNKYELTKKQAKEMVEDYE
tara:strand:- start:994 stop:1149 length:156 start_codon:yes stop_codon:yes gene_type:complete